MASIISLIVGLFAGATLAVLIVSLFVVSRSEEEAEELIGIIEKHTSTKRNEKSSKDCNKDRNE